MVRRYGARASAGRTDALVQAALGELEVGRAEAEAACGTCGRVVQAAA